MNEPASRSQAKRFAAMGDAYGAYEAGAAAGEYIKKLEAERDALKKALQGLLEILPDTRRTLLARSEAEFALQEKK